MRVKYLKVRKACRLIAPLRARLHQLGGDGSPAQAGSAIVEFVFLAVLMIVPLFYLVMVLARLQAGAYGVSAGHPAAGDGRRPDRRVGPVSLRRLGDDHRRVACTVRPALAVA